MYRKKAKNEKLKKKVTFIFFLQLQMLISPVLKHLETSVKKENKGISLS